MNHAIEEAIRDLRRIDRHMTWNGGQPGELTRRTIAAVASRLLRAAMVEGVAEIIKEE